MIDLTLKDLQLIEAIAECGTLTGATRRLHVTQSAVSQRLSNLHTRLDMTLVERHDGGMRLTPAGDRVLAAAQVVGTELQSATRDLNRLASQTTAQFQIATQCYTCYRWLPFVIRAMRDRFPLLNIDVVPDATDSPYTAIEKGDIDVAIVSNPNPDSSLSEFPLFDDELFAVVSPSHPLAQHRYLEETDFIGQSLVLYTGSKHAVVEEILRPAGVSDYSLVQVRITEAIIELARAGQGIAVIAGWALDDIPDVDDLVAVRITEDGFKRTWRAVFEDQGTNEYRDNFIRNVKQVGATIGRRKWRRRLQIARSA